MDTLVLAVNGGSASKKYALYKNDVLLVQLHFEYEDGQLIRTKTDDIGTFKTTAGFDQLTDATQAVAKLLYEEAYLHDDQKLSGIGVRIVAPTSNFLSHQFLDDTALAQLAALTAQAPLHIGTTLADITALQAAFIDTPIFAVSDSAFHADKPDYAWNYGISLELADQHEIKRFGYHGISTESIVQKLADARLLEDKLIVCHLGSGSSVTAVKQGKSIETTMGYSPLEGLIMATRSGSIDVIAANQLKAALGADDQTLEAVLNQQSGLLGISGFSDDIRSLLAAEKEGHYRAGLALRMYVYHVQKAIGQMAAVLGGVDTLVFTGTVGARSAVLRERIVAPLDFLNLAIKPAANQATYEPVKITSISPRTRQRHIYVITTDESYEIAWRTSHALRTN